MNILQNIKKHLLPLSALLFLSLTFYASPVLAQDEDEDVEEKFVNLGLISISDLFTLPSQTNTIVFRIRNNASRTISQIFGWVYMYDKVANSRGDNFVLMNNPHRGGNILKGTPHRPGTIAEWSFPLVREPFIANQDIGYSLRVHPRSIFFATIEPRNDEASTP